MSEITLTDTAAALVKADVSAFKRDGKRYADYIAEMGVTLETVSDHVAIFRSEFKRLNPKADGAQVKAYATKVRNGLNYNLGKSGSSTVPTALLTSLGVKATKDEVIAAWEAAQK